MRGSRQKILIKNQQPRFKKEKKKLHRNYGTFSRFPCPPIRSHWWCGVWWLASRYSGSRGDRDPLLSLRNSLASSSLPPSLLSTPREPRERSRSHHLRSYASVPLPAEIHGRRAARWRAFATAAAERSSSRAGGTGAESAGFAEVRAHAVPHQDVPARGRPRGERHHLVERRWFRVRRLAPHRVRARPPPQVLQAQQLLQLRAPAQHLRVQEDHAGQVGVRQRLFPAREEAPALRHPPAQGHAVRGADGGGHGRGDAAPGRAASGLAGVLRRGAGAVVELVARAPDEAAAVRLGLRRRGVRRRRRGERPPAARERAARARARADEEALQQHPPPHVQVRRHAAARRRQGRELLRRVGGGRTTAAAAAASVDPRAHAVVPRRARCRRARRGDDGGGRGGEDERQALRRVHRAETDAGRRRQRLRRGTVPPCGRGEAGADGRAAPRAAPAPSRRGAAGLAHLPAHSRPGWQRVGSLRVKFQVIRPSKPLLS